MRCASVYVALWADLPSESVELIRSSFAKGCNTEYLLLPSNAINQLKLPNTPRASWTDKLFIATMEL